MKVRISYTVEVDAYFRKALNAYYGKEGLASREDIQLWHEEYGDSMDDDMLTEYHHKLEEGKE